MNIVLKKFPKLSGSKIVNETVRLIINLLVTDLINNSNKNIKNKGILTSEDVKDSNSLTISFSDDIKKMNIELKRFLYSNLYQHPDVKKMTDQANTIISDLFSAYISYIKLLPSDFYEYNLEKINADHKERVICDYIAGMTDRFAQQEHNRLF